MSIYNCNIKGSYYGGLFFYESNNQNITISDSNIISTFAEGIVLYNSLIENFNIFHSKVYKGFSINSENIINFNVNDTIAENKKYIKVFENVKNIIINNSSIYQLILINSSNVKIHNLALNNTFYLIKTDNISVFNCIINGTTYGIVLLDTNTNLKFIGNYIINGIINYSPLTNLILNDTNYGNYWANSDGTGYSQICNDTNHDGICDLPYDPLNDQVITLSSDLNEPTLKLNTLRLATSYIDYKPLAIWPYVTKNTASNISYLPNSNKIVATIHSDFSGTANYNLEIEGATFNTGNINLSNGENNLSIPLEDIKFCGFQNVTLKIGNNTITKQLNFGSCEVFSSGGGAYEAPENLFYIFIVLIFGIFYEIMRKDKK